MKERKENNLKESAGSSAFWGVCCENGKKYAHVTKKKLHITMAVLDVTVEQTTDIVSVVMEICGNQHLLCHLSKQITPQVHLDLFFEQGESVTFFIKGVGMVFLNGYHMADTTAVGQGNSTSIPPKFLELHSSPTRDSCKVVNNVQKTKVLNNVQKQKEKDEVNTKKNKDSREEFYCDLCGSYLPSEEIKAVHMAGKKHLKKIREQQSGETSSQDISAISTKSDNSFGNSIAELDLDDSDADDDDFDLDEVSDSEEDDDDESESDSDNIVNTKMNKDPRGELHCDLCDIYVTSKEGMAAHKAGKRHLKKIKEQQAGETSSQDISAISTKSDNNFGNSITELDLDDSDADDDDFDLDEMSESDEDDEDEDESESDSDNIGKSSQTPSKQAGTDFITSPVAKSTPFTKTPESSDESSSESSDDIKKKVSILKNSKKRPVDSKDDKNKSANKKIKISQPTYRSENKAKLKPADLNSSVGRTPMPKNKSQIKNLDTESLPDEKTPAKSLSFSDTPSKKEKIKKKKEAATPTKLAGGLEVTDIRLGSGPAANRGRLVHLYYEGSLQNGMVFDRCQKGQNPFRFRLGSGHVIEGWEKGIEGMRAGGMRKLTIPPALAYKNKSVGKIPANSTLNFVVTLKAVS